MKKLKPIERIYMSLDELERMERDILNRRHVERYAMVRQWCKGNVLDFACGCGYGTYLVSKNPDIDFIFGVDVDESAIDWAKENYSSEKIEFILGKIEDFQGKIDTLICLETIEHIKDLNLIPENCDRLEIKELFISFPSKKTTHYNKYHHYDFNTQWVCDLFTNYRLVKEINLHEEVKILNFLRK